MNAKEKEKLILAIEEMGPTVTVAQVAKKTGLSGNLVFAGLRDMIAATGGNLQVVKDGEINFVFPFNFALVYQQKDRSIWFDEALRAAFEMAFFVARIVFAIMLVAMIILFLPFEGRALLIYLFLIFGGTYLELTAVDQESWEHLPGEGKKALKQSLGFARLARLFSYRYRERQLDLKSSLREMLREEPIPDTRGTSFFNICFSWVFGDGNPNVNFEELKWQVVAEVIRQQNGAVVTDQLAPYLCCAPEDDQEMLPVLQRFNGYPQAVGSGNLVYLFPDLMAAEKEKFRVPSFLIEQTWRFSDLTFPQILPVWIISTLFFWASYYQFFHPGSMDWLWHGLWAAGLPLWELLVPFSIFFCLVPALRYIYISITDSEIEERNKLRKYFAEMVHKPDNDLFQKLLDRKECELEDRLIQKSPGDVIYTTRKPLDEQDVQGQEFDRDVSA